MFLHLIKIDMEDLLSDVFFYENGIAIYINAKLIKVVMHGYI